MRHIRSGRVWVFGLSLLLLLCISVSALADANWLCPSCGRENISSYSYCPACGTARSTSQTVTCSACGTRVTMLEGYRYCPACGSRLSANSQLTATPKPTATATATPKPTATATPRPTATAAPTSTAAPRSTATPLATAAPGNDGTSLPDHPSSSVFYWYNESTRSYYHQLTPQEKQLFSLLYDGIMNFEAEIHFPEGFTVSMYNRVINVIWYDCPEIIQCSECTAYRRGETLVYVKPKYCLTRDAYAQHWSAVQGAIEDMRFLPGFSDSDYSKQFAIYRYIIEHSYYEVDKPYTVYADSVYWYGRAQCTGYTRALNLALRYYGIPCMEVTGHTYTDGKMNSDEGHEWTIACIDGLWYQCDVTWDDPTWERSDYPVPFPDNGNAYLRYFNQTDDFMLKNRTVDDLGFTRPACFSTFSNYAYREGVYVTQWKDDPVGYVQKQILVLSRRGMKTITIQFESAADYQTVYDHLQDMFRDLKDTGGVENTGSYSWWYDEEANFLYIVVP